MKSMKMAIILLVGIISYSLASGWLNSYQSLDVQLGDLWVSNYHGYQVSLRINDWPKPYYSRGYEIFAAPFLEGNHEVNFYRAHISRGLYFRKLGSMYPYVIGTCGIQYETERDGIYDSNQDRHESYNGKVSMGVSLRVGLSYEWNVYRISIEQGGGSMGSGHVETNLSLGYAFSPLPDAGKFKKSTVTVGAQSFIRFSGKYMAEPGGYDFSVIRAKNGKLVKDNIGIFMTDYIMSTGVFHGGRAWKINQSKKFGEYFSILPGFQVLLWAEPEPDFILPAGSLELEINLPIRRFRIYGRTRFLGTYSPYTGMITGVLLSTGIGMTL